MEEFKDITHEELKEWIDKDKEFTLIDVLDPESYEVRHLPGAVNVNLRGNFIARVEELMPEKDSPVVVYCASFSCQASPSAASELVDAGYTNVYDFVGGIEDWDDAGYLFE